MCSKVVEFRDGERDGERDGFLRFRVIYDF